LRALPSRRKDDRLPRTGSVKSSVRVNAS
jgi:hypothetical protein